jgi:mannose-1-phosphate guanylyltransferase
VSATPPRTPIERFAAVIPAGGIGSRLWPLSQPDRPKFLLDLLGSGRSLLQATVDRLEPISDELVIVTGARHADAVASQLPQLTPGQILAEPSPRDSMAAIALAAAVLEERHGPMVMGSFAADHVIPDADAFRETVQAAARVAAGGDIVTLGIEPTGPSSAFGYIEAGAHVADGQALRVVAFTEKPSEDVAAGFLARGGYFWNAGMFVTRTDVLLGHLDEQHADLAAGVREIARSWDSERRSEVVEDVWPTLTKIAIDHAIAEPVAAAGGIAVVPAAFQWDDVGDFDSLAAMLASDEGEGVVVNRAEPTVFDSSPGALAIGGDKPVVIIGAPDVVVVDTPEATLVVSRALAQRVKDAAAAVDAARTP